MAALPIIAGIGAGLGVLGSFAQGQQSAAAAKYNANVASTNAGLVIQQSQSQAKLQQVQSEMAIGSARADYGASGVGLQGSGMDVLESSANRAETARQTILYNGQTQAGALNAQAQFYRNQVTPDLVQGYAGGIAKGFLSYAQIQNAFGSGTGGNPLGNVNALSGGGDQLNYAGGFGEGDYSDYLRRTS